MNAWTSDSWRADALQWAADHGVVPAEGVTQPRLRPWSTALRIPAAHGLFWFKAGGPGTAYEAGLVRALDVYGAPHVLAPVAVDVERGWLLLPDGGPTLRELGAGLADWERLLPKYAELQRSLEHRGLPGVPDHRPARLPALFADLLEHVEVPPEVHALQPTLATWCDELATSGIRPTLQHDDLHDNNVFGNDVIFDWGDAVLGFPFTTMLVTLRVAQSTFDLATGGPELTRLRDAYLEAWTDTHSRLELELLTLLATRVGKVGRADAWRRALLDVDDPGEHAEAVPGWLEELLEEDVF